MQETTKSSRKPFRQKSFRGGRDRFAPRGAERDQGSFRQERGSFSSSPRRGFRPRNMEPLVASTPTAGELAHLNKLAAQATENKTGFAQLGLSPLLLGSLASQEFSEPMPIQAKVLPIALTEKDILACAQTGTGKTLAFVVPALQKLLNSPTGKALILAPTRELGLQIEEVVKPLSKKMGLGLPVILIGGVSYVHQFRQLAAPHRIIIATPGRLIDHLDQKKVSLAEVNTLVLDEADRMLDVGFRPQLDEILEHLPRERQTMLFTATLTRGVQQLIQKYLKNPATVSLVTQNETQKNIQQRMIPVSGKKKTDAVLELLKEMPGSALLFVRTQMSTERISQDLLEYGVEATPIHGGLSQGQRKRALDSFRHQKTRVLVATDVAARGLDIDHVNLVINYDLPNVLEDYIHRIGRTGRAGRTGQAVSLVGREDQKIWKLLSRKYRIQ
jgi:superfamily II DNA/RNA helicase